MVEKLPKSSGCCVTIWNLMEAYGSFNYWICVCKVYFWVPRGLPGETLDIDSLLCNLIRFNTAGMPAVTGCQRFKLPEFHLQTQCVGFQDGNNCCFFCLINQLPSLQRSAPRNLSEMWWWLGLASAKPAWVSRWRVHSPMWGPPFGSLSISKPVLWWFFRLLSNFRILSGL